MNLKKILTNVVKIVVEEAEQNASFRSRLEEALGSTAYAPTHHVPPRRGRQDEGEGHRRGRRSAAVLDPVELIAQGQGRLRARLADLDHEQLLDVVAQYGMDPGKLVMKWKDRDRVIDRIIEVSLARATKGDAFRRD
jgi:hypothetical protein